MHSWRASTTQRSMARARRRGAWRQAQGLARRVLLLLDPVAHYLADHARRGDAHLDRGTDADDEASLALVLGQDAERVRRPASDRELLGRERASLTCGRAAAQLHRTAGRHVFDEEPREPRRPARGSARRRDARDDLRERRGAAVAVLV